MARLRTVLSYLARTKVPNEHTEEVTGYIEGFDGMRTLLHQRHHQWEIFLVKPRQSELPEVDAAWEGQ